MLLFRIVIFILIIIKSFAGAREQEIDNFLIIIANFIKRCQFKDYKMLENHLKICQKCCYKAPINLNQFQKRYKNKHFCRLKYETTSKTLEVCCVEYKTFEVPENCPYYLEQFLLKG